METTSNLKAKLAIATAIISAFVGYGRRAYAVASACDLISSGTYVCSGQTTSTQTFGPGNANVITTNGFVVNTSTGDAIYFNGTGAFTFTDKYSSIIKATGVSSTAIDGYSSGGAITITTGKGSSVSSQGGLGIYGGSFGGGGAVTITTGADSSVSGSNGIEAFSNTNNTITITTGLGSSVVGLNEGMNAQAHSDIMITIGNGSNVSGAKAGVIGESSSGTVTITNQGTIKNTSNSSADLAIGTFVDYMGSHSGTSNSVITNTRTGLITGTVILDNMITNSLTNNGTWNTAGGTNNFYIGATNTIINAADGLILAANAVFNNATFQNAGVLSMQNGTPGDTITVNGDFIGQNGAVKMDSVLGSDGSLSDVLVITGGASGTTRLFINNVGGNGQLTSGQGILVVDVGQEANPNAFILGEPVSAGAYEYQLFYDGTSSSDPEWFLRNTLASGAPNYRVEVPLDEVLPLLAQQFGMTMLDTLDDRVGSYIPYEKGNKRSPAWLRIIGQYGDRNQGHSFPDFSKRSPSYNWSMEGVQAGYDVIRKTYENGASDVIGSDVAVGHISSDVQQAYNKNNAGHINMTGYNYGVYWTHYGAGGWYSDAVVQGTTYKY